MKPQTHLKSHSTAYPTNMRLFRSQPPSNITIAVPLLALLRARPLLCALRALQVISATLHFFAGDSAARASSPRVDAPNLHTNMELK